MSDLLWFHGITGQTPIRDIGWTYVLLIMLGGLLTWLIKSIFR